DESGRVRVWNRTVEPPGLRCWFVAGQSPVVALAYQPGGELLSSVCAGWGGPVRLWDLGGAGGAVGRTAFGDGLALALAFNRGGDQLAVPGASGRIALWDTASAQPRVVLTLDSESWPAKGVAYAAGQVLAVASMDGRVLTWDAKTGRLLGQW